uniref:Protein kinase domain-containing protein n=1 Tax=Pyrodinium bahamense TaxID=73915 RepID=A0A7S0AMT4_9DINO|mmetsp:Transcript_37510/g.104277  ORF Transcript_37510/g.104277 Transcript_37510/m.104277 type:complete len:892 (+) Transcript_37510:75-2750(+)
MLVSVVQTAAPLRYTAAAQAAATTVQCPTQRWCYRPASPTIRAPAAQVLRPRRATVATASPEATTAWEALPEGPPLGTRRCRQVEALQRLPQRLEPELDFGARMPAPLPSIWRDKYELSPDTPALGGGAFAEVFKVRHRHTYECFAVKVMHRPNFALRGIEKQIEAEIQAMRMAADAAQDGRMEGHIVQLLDVAEEYDYVFLLLELCEEGDLLRKLHAEPLQRFHEDAGAMWARQLLLGLKTLHRLGFLHRDIKPDNLLCTEGSILKIADFGWCSLLEEAPTCLAGTFQYMAPEVLRNKPQTEAVDVWSAGVTLHQMLVGKPLLTTYLGPGATQLTDCDPHRATAVKQRRLLAEIAATCPPSYDRRPPHLSPLCWDFLRQLLIPEAEQRMTVEVALRHPWLMKAEAHGNTTQVATVTAPWSEPLVTARRRPCERREERQAAVEEPHIAACPEVASREEPEETGRDRLERSMEVPRSPQCSRTQDPRSPSTGRGSVNSIDNVPTPLKPRSWDPHRNMAYTPPMENNSTPEVSPERKARLLMSSDRVSTYNVSPKDILDRTLPSRSPLSRLSPPAPPPRTLDRRLGGSVVSRPSPASGPNESPVTLRCQPRIDQHAANVLLRKLHSCNEQLRQIQSAMLHPDHRFQDTTPQAGMGDAQSCCVLRTSGSACLSASASGSACLSASGSQSEERRRAPRHSILRGTSTERGESMHVLDASVAHDLEPILGGFDVLTATAPPHLGASTPGVLAPIRVLDASSRTSVEGVTSARGRENVLPSNPVALSTATPSTPWKGKPVVQNGVVCYAAAPRYAAIASPLKARHAAPPPSSSRITQAAQPQQSQHILLRVPSPGAPQVSSQATVWTQPMGSSHLRSGITRRRASAPSQWVQACEQR